MTVPSCSHQAKVAAEAAALSADPDHRGPGASVPGLWGRQLTWEGMHEMLMTSMRNLASHAAAQSQSADTTFPDIFTVRPDTHRYFQQTTYPRNEKRHEDIQLHLTHCPRRLPTLNFFFSLESFFKMQYGRG